MYFGQKMMKYITTFLMVLSSCVVLAEDVPPVQKLRQLYETNQDFHNTMDNALANVKSPYNGAENPWKGKTFDDFCHFFDDWYRLLPINNGEPNPPSAFPPGQSVDEFVYVTEFAGFYYENESAQKVVMQEPGLSWTKDFVTSRGLFMDSKESTTTIPQWMADPSIHIDQYIVPPDGFQSFNEFFTPTSNLARERLQVLPMIPC